MKPAYFQTIADREAYDHGRAQGKLEIARSALQQILEISRARGRKRSMLAVEVRARMALEASEPDLETNYRGGL